MSAYTDLAALTLDACRAQALKKLVFSRPVSGDILRAAGTLCRIGGKTVLQIESFYKDNKAKHENLALDENLPAFLADRFLGFSQINLLTTAGDAELRVTKKGALALLGADKLSRRLSGDAEMVELAGNDKQKKRILTGEEPFLRELGVADDKGRVYDKKQSKFRQINRFLELVSDTVSHLPSGKLRILDLCCGKSYLSFAVYHYFANVLGREVEMTGVDLKPDVVEYCQTVSKNLHFDGLEFLCGDVGKYETEGADLVVSLHACDTATDLVLERAMKFGAKVILATPCCHHELNHTLNCQPLAFVARHSMLRQKLCDAATDALRLLLLEANGYEVSALELIDPEETPKNVMLRAVLSAPNQEKMQKAQAEYAAARTFLLGVK